MEDRIDDGIDDRIEDGWNLKDAEARIETIDISPYIMLLTTIETQTKLNEFQFIVK